MTDERWYNVPLIRNFSYPVTMRQDAFRQEHKICQWLDTVVSSDDYEYQYIMGFFQHEDFQWDRVYVMRIRFFNETLEAMFLLQFGDDVAKMEIYF